MPSHGTNLQVTLWNAQCGARFIVQMRVYLSKGNKTTARLKNGTVVRTVVLTIKRLISAWGFPVLVSSWKAQDVADAADGYPTLQLPHVLSGRGENSAQRRDGTVALPTAGAANADTMPRTPGGTLHMDVERVFLAFIGIRCTAVRRCIPAIR